MGRASDAKEGQDTTGKVMATELWEAKCVIMLHFLPKRSIITGEY